MSVLSFPPFGFWLLSLVGIALLLRLLRDQNTETARNLGLLYGLAYGLGTMYWFFDIFSVFAIPLIAIFAAYFGLLATLIAMTKGIHPIARALLVGLFAAGIEWLRGDAWYLRFPWYTVPHALAQEPPWIAPVRWQGTYGFTFCLWTVAAWGAFGRYWPWAAFTLIPAASLLLPEFKRADHRALLVQAEKTYDLERLIEQIPRNKVDLAVLPELAYFIKPAAVLKSGHGPTLVAKRCGCPVVFGAVEGNYATTDFENVAVIIDAQGKPVGSFTKQRPVPLFRDGVPGRTRPVFKVNEMVIGVAICYDFDAPEIAANLVDQGAGVLVAPTFDAMSWGRMQHVHHELLLRLRALENDRWIVRTASSGRSEVINPHGEPSAQGIEIGETGFAVVDFGYSDSLPLGGQAYLFGPVAAAGSALFLMIYLTRLLWCRRAAARSKSTERV
jgi:apolipoprotein N-acyltransferase